MSSLGSTTGYLFLVSVNGVVSTLNRQQLLGSMPKMLDALGQGDEVCVRLIDQQRFAQLVAKLLEDDAAG